MRYLFLACLTLVSLSAFAVECDCEVWVYTPLTGSKQIAPERLRKFELEEFNNYLVRNQHQCRRLCHERYLADLPSERLDAMLVTHAQDLIREEKLGFNCTGLTTLKFPVRVKAKLGGLGLGNVADVIQVVNHEQVCFNP